MPEEVVKELKRRMLSAQADLDEKRGHTLLAMESIYANPRRALRHMSDFAKQNGDKALMQKVETYPAYFGSIKGYPGSGTALSLQGFKDRAIAKDTYASLPGLVRSTIEAEKKFLGLEKAYSETGIPPGRGGPDKGKGGPDFG